MKKIILILVYAISFYNSYCLNNIPFDLKRLTTDFNGVESNGSSIIAYGNNGIILTSNDLGKSWNQININDNLNINKVILKNNQYVGLLGNNIISSIDGNKWIITSINTQDSLISLIYGNNDLYLLSNNSILKLDNDFKIINKLNISILDTFKVSEIQLFHNKLLIPIYGNKIISYDLNTNNTETIIFDKLNLTKLYKPLNLSSDGNNLYISLNNDLYKSDDFGKSWNLFTKNSYTYSIFGSKVYNLENNSSNLHYNKYEFNLIENNIKINQVVDLKYRYIKQYNFIELKFINDNNIIAVGADKLIMMSSNQGKNWEIISHLEYKKAFDDFYILDSLHIYWCALKFQIFKTTDAGVTWKPQYYTSDSINLFTLSGYNKQKLIFNEDGYGFNYVSGTNVNGGNFDLNYMWTKDNGETYNFGMNIDLVYGIFPGTNFPYTIDAIGKKFLIINSSNPGYRFSLQYMFDDKMRISKRNLFDSLQFYNMILDENENIYGIAVNYRYPNSTNPYLYDSISYLIKKSIDGGEKWSDLYRVKFPIRNIAAPVGKVNNIFNGEELIFNENYSLGTQIYYKPNGEIDTIIPGYDLDSLYSININNNKIRKIFGSNSIFNYVFNIDNRLYLYSSSFSTSEHKDYSLFFENSTPSVDLNNWKLIDFTNTISYRGSLKNASYFYINSNLFVNYSKSETSIEQTEDQTYFYSYPPFPTPSINEVKSLIYWDMSYNIDDSDISIYDIYGNKVANRDKISINKLNAYSGYLTWDCSGAGTGVYMIQIKHGTNIHNIRSMVVR